MAMNDMIFSNRLKNAREAVGLSQEQLANCVRMNKCRISQFESGRDVPYRELAVALAPHVKVDPEELVRLACEQACARAVTRVKQRFGF